MAVAIHHIVGFYFGKDGYAAVSFFLRRIGIDFIACAVYISYRYIFFISLYFLQAYYISRVCFQPVDKAFFCRAADTVNVISDDSH